MVQPSQLLSTAEAARLLGVTRRQVLDLAAANPQFPTSQAAATGGRTWLRAGIQAWAAEHPQTDPVFTGPKVPPVGTWPPQVRQVITLASREALALNHPWSDLDHLVLGMLHTDCPGAARAVLESFGIDVATLRQVLIDNLGDPFDTKASGVSVSPDTALVLERANLQAARLADAEVTSEHVLLALTSQWNSGIVTSWLARCGITPKAVRRRVVDVTEGVALPEPAPLGEPGPELVSTAGVDLALNPLGKNPLRRRPWASVAFQVPQGRPHRAGMLARQYFLDRDGYPVLTTDGRPVHIVVDEQGIPVLDPAGRYALGPVEVPPGATVTAHHSGT